MSRCIGEAYVDIVFGRGGETSSVAFESLRTNHSAPSEIDTTIDPSGSLEAWIHNMGDGVIMNHSDGQAIARHANLLGIQLNNYHCSTTDRVVLPRVRINAPPRRDCCTTVSVDRPVAAPLVSKKQAESSTVDISSLWHRY